MYEPDLALGVFEVLVNATNQGFFVAETVSFGPALATLCDLFVGLWLPIGRTHSRDGNVGVSRLVCLLPFAPVDRPSPPSV